MNEELILVLDTQKGKVHIEYAKPSEGKSVLLGSECSCQDLSHMSKLCAPYMNNKEDLLYMMEDIKTYLLDGLFIRNELLASPDTEENVRKFLEENEDFHFGKDSLCQSCFGKFFSFVSEGKMIKMESE